MLVADAKVRTAYHSVRLIPASLFVAGNDIGERYNKLILDLVDTRNKLITVIDTEVYSATHDFIKRTGKTETKLRSNLESIVKVIDRYPSPDLVKLKDSIAGKLEAVKQVSVEPVEPAIKRIKEELKDVPNFIDKAQDARKKKLFDDSYKWKMRISEVAERAAALFKSQYDALTKVEGNTSSTLYHFIENERKVSGVNGYYNHEHDLSTKEEEEWIKSLNLNDKVAKAREIITDAEQDIVRARALDAKGDSVESYILYDRARFSLARSTSYTAGLSISEIGESTSSKQDNLRDETDKYTSSYQSKFQEQDALFTRGIAKRLRTIEASLKEAEVLAKKAEGVLKYYHPMRVAGLVKQASRKDYDRPNVKVSANGEVSPYNKGDELKSGDRIGYSYVSYAELPRIDTGETFNGLSSKKRRVHEASVRVINTSNLEVGTSFNKMKFVKDLIGEAKTGEFDLPIAGDFTTDDSLCIRQTTPASGIITSVISHFKLGG
nr:hypothetical protein [Candidatus Liberibacter solanacearum]